MEKNLSNNRLERVNKYLKQGNFQQLVDEIKHWIEDTKIGEIILDLENQKVRYKRDSQDTINTAITAKVEEKLKEIMKQDSR